MGDMASLKELVVVTAIGSIVALGMSFGVLWMDLYLGGT
jgi:hypothetical protein